MHPVKSDGPIIKLFKTIFLLSVILLGACDDKEARFEAAKTQALKNPDPWQAYAQIGGDAVIMFRCEPNESFCLKNILHKYHDLALTLYTSALKQHSPAAFVDLFTRPDPPVELKGRMPELAAELVKMAGSSRGDHASKDILRVAAGLLEEGKWVEKDSVRAAAFYARAWNAGDSYAPASLSQLYSAQHDDASALLWQFRCTGICYSRLAHDDVPASLSTRKILRIESLARDHSILTVNGQADWEAK
ncbi:hypothetical protein [Pantoea stewartii]|uniref:hypothetical protein n=1 Tax=Pantoea stewartii TaxID=66269 RepID=UPI00345C20E2